MNFFGEGRDQHRSKVYSVDVTAQMMMMINSQSVFEQKRRRDYVIVM